MTRTAVVAQTRIHELRWPIDPPLDLAGRAIAERRYVVLEVVLDDGLTGTAYCLTRGAPVFDELEHDVAARLRGRGIDELLAAAARGTAVPGDAGASHRAHSLLDICAWDLRAQTSELPLWRSLAPSATPLPALGEHGAELRAWLQGDLP